MNCVPLPALLTASPTIAISFSVFMMLVLLANKPNGKNSYDDDENDSYSIGWNCLPKTWYMLRYSIGNYKRMFRPIHTGISYGFINQIGCVNNFFLCHDSHLPSLSQGTLHA